MAQIPSPIEQLILPAFEKDGLQVWIKRDDLIHPHIMGNKWRKLKYNIQKAKSQNKIGLLSFGGAYSNHIAATAACAQENDLRAIGIIRGDELNYQSNPTLRFAHEQGMELVFVSRTEYRNLKNNPTPLISRHPDYYLLPEGGTNRLAIDGCVEIIEEIPFAFDYVLSAYGTGGTLAGLVKGSEGKGHVIGVSSLKGNWVHIDFRALCLKNDIQYTNYSILDNYHFGGYGKVDDRLIDFINVFRRNTQIPLDPIYTGKMLYAFMGLVSQEFFRKGSKIVLLHTGGLQGIKGFNENRSGKHIY